MQHSLSIVDAFTDQPFAGNPAAVCVLNSPRSKDWMSRVAAEMNLSETAFLWPLAGGEWSLRWFTPLTEVALCGHATLASAFVLWHHYGFADAVLGFQTASGRLCARRIEGAIELDFPSIDYRELTSRDAGYAAVLGIQPQALYRSGEDVMAVLDDAEAVRSLAIDKPLLAQLPSRGLIVTALSDLPGVDFVSRFFAPQAGIDEDPVTGSAHCVLAPFWARRLGKQAMSGYQLSARGGLVKVELKGDRVLLMGSAVPMMTGALSGSVLEADE